jgi:release factor glutamine methyltransferase
LPRGCLKSARIFSALTARSEALAGLTDLFQRSGIDDAKREARKALYAACGVSPIALILEPDKPLGSALGRVEEFARRRATGEPLSRIVGAREFWGLSLAISPEVLDPRPETETIVEVSVRVFRERREDTLCILDLGVGSGALLCALLSEFTNAEGFGVDISPAAANVALNNIESCGLTGRAEIRVGDWARGLEGRFDLIVSNPPYIASKDFPSLSCEVRNFDPRLALDGGSKGLEAYKRILPECQRLLSVDGWLLLEIGAGKVIEVLKIAEKCGFRELRTHRDLSGFERVVAARSRGSKVARNAKGTR